jgi:hypothetical protein
VSHPHVLLVRAPAGWPLGRLADVVSRGVLHILARLAGLSDLWARVVLGGGAGVAVCYWGQHGGYHRVMLPLIILEMEKGQ